MFKGHSSNRRYLFAMLSLLFATLQLQDGCWGQPPRAGDRPGDSRTATGSGDIRAASDFWALFGKATSETRSARRDFWRLLTHPAVLAEIGIDQNDEAAIEAINKDHMIQLQESVKSEAKENRLELLINTLQQQDEEFTQLLKDRADFPRLIQIDVQVYGMRAATHVCVAKLIGLSDEKATELRAFSNEIRKQEMEKIRDNIRDVMRTQADKKVRELFRQIDGKVDDAIRMKLNSQQIEALNALKGAPFQIPEDLFDRRRPPGERRDSKDRNQKDCDL